MSLLGKRIKYINEGNAHIVLHVIDTDYVIRIIKENGVTANINTISNSVNYVNLVMVPLVFGFNKYRHEVIELPPEEIVKLSIYLKDIRPKHRLVKSVFSKYAIKAPNLAIISSNSENYCLELKPKEGFLSESFKKISKCYYCLKQHLKVDEKQIICKTDYCPLDLFSGDHIRMKRALINLIKNPQNNLKLFQNENIVYDEKSNMEDFEDLITKNIFSSVNKFNDFIIAILLNDGISNLILKESPDLKIVKPNYCYESKNLNANSFLYKLLAIQMVSETFESQPLNLNTIESEDLEYVPILITSMKENNIDLTNEIHRKKFMDTTNSKDLALISAVAKDCSVMISYSLTPNDKLPFVKIDNTDVYYSVSVTDLEPKSPKTLVKRQKTERKLLEIYEKLLNS
ncbi:inositol-pentakisphosphate 2-kinase isoform X1 [Bicyclus anynana]|uniref:Inositol-pentakisphosphate 2-kinase n=1 Tax=Bicyclus anynana TaxID=110368 RepID=A0ABM3M722_BICAN|nr:inositol-pentakisphosphate 2-kinase isoform X1 [Bicyclus anynana]